MHFLRTRARVNSRFPLACRAILRLEQLETRIVPYALTGSAWPNPQLITLSFEPDGTTIMGGTSNLFATLNARYPTSMWENQFIKAAQVWAQQTNINFQVIADSGAETGSGNYQQGDPTMGDIRIGGAPLGITNEPLAFAFLPPPSSNYSIAGDVVFNTSYSWVIGGCMGYDIFTVAAHEIGHSLGLGESNSSPYAIMWGSYAGQRTSLNSDDITGIRLIYSSGNARSYDSFNDTNTSFSTAANLTSLIDPSSLTALETGLDISTTSQKEYFSITAPQGTSSTMTVTVQSTGLSLLAPSLTVYNSSETQIATTSGSGELGSTISLNITGVSAGAQYYVVVGGANTTSFGTGDYAMTFQFGSTAPPAVPLPNTQVLDGNPSYAGNLPDQPSDPDGDSGTLANFPHPEAATVPPQPPAPSAAEMLLAGTPKAAAGVTPLSAAASVTALPLTSLLPFVTPNFLPSESHLARLESGSGNDTLDALFKQNSVQPSLPSTDESDAPAAADETPGETTAAQSALPSVPWRQAADTYFCAEPLAADSTATGQDQATLSNEEFTPLFEAAAAAALALTLEPKGLNRRDQRLEASGRPVRRLFRL
jgi:hypothetical protein